MDPGTKDPLAARKPSASAQVIFELKLLAEDKEVRDSLRLNQNFIIS